MSSLGDALKKALNNIEFEDKSKELIEIQEIVEKQIESSNAETIEYGHDERRVFSQYISRENAEAIINVINESQRITALNKDSFKERLLEICNSIVAQGQSPVEMLVYSTKSNNYNIYVESAVLDILSELHEIDKGFIKAYSHILKRWTWHDQVLLVIKSCINLNLVDMAENLINIVEKNELLRVDASRALVALNQEQYYGKIVNLFAAIQNETREIGDISKDLFYKVSRSEKGKNALLKAYFETNNRSLFGIFQSAIDKNINEKDIKYIMQHVEGNQTLNRRKAVMLLGKIKSKYSVEVLRMLRNNPKIDKKDYVIALGYTNSSEVVDILEEIVMDKHNSIDIRSSALISIGNLRDNSKLDFINKCFDEAVNNNEELMEIAAASVLVQLEDFKKIKNIFKYIITPNIDEKYVSFARGQLKRIRGLRNPHINGNLDQVAEKTLERIQDEDMIYNILYILSNGASELSNNIMLNMLQTSNSDRIKCFLLEYFKRNYNILDDTMQTEIRKAFVEFSNSNKYDVREEAMRSLKVINRREDSTPILNY